MTPPEFAAYDPESALGAWPDVVVRDLEPRDVEPCAVILAEREGWTYERSYEAVSRWLAVTGERSLLLAAEHDGVLHGYGRAGYVDVTAEADDVPVGWYLTGVVVAPSARRRGLGALLTRERLRRLARVTDEAWYFASVDNRVTIALHEAYGFRLHMRDFRFPGVTFAGGGALFRCDLTGGER